MNNLTIPAYSEQAAQAVKERLDSLAKASASLRNSPSALPE